MTTAMEIETPASLADDNTDATFTLESLSEPLLSFAKDALSKKSENNASNLYDTLETQLREHLLQLVSSSSSSANDNASNVLHDEWMACWKLCEYLLHECPDLDRFIRKLPFVLLEDLVESLPIETLQDFYMSLDTIKLCSGILWETPPEYKNQSHVLQYIRLYNALLGRISPTNTQLAGTVLMDMAQTLSLSDRSALKQWGSVSGRTTDYDDEDEQEDDAVLEQEDTLTAANKETQEVAHAFHQVFWSVQQDMHNPYSISFAIFFQNVKQILAAMESKTILSTSTTSTTNKYLTKSRLLPLQLQDATFCQHWLTQFLIIESFVSSQSPKLKTTLDGLSNRTKALLRKLPNGTLYLQRLQYILTNSEDIWRQWKRNKCKPDMEITITEKDGSEDVEMMDTTTTQDTAATHEETETPLKLEDLQETARTTMAIPSLESHLEDYVDALDPEAGIEAEYHPRNDKLYCWRSLRLLGRQHLDYFGQIRRSDGDFEGMVRDIYRQERNVDIPGERPQQEVVEDYDEDIGGSEANKEVEEAKDKAPPPAAVVDKDEIMLDTPQELEVSSETKQVAVAKKGGDDEPAKDSEKAADDVGKEASEEETANVEEKEDEASEVKDAPKDKETDKKPEAKETTEPSKPTKPLTAFEKAAMEEEELLIAEEEEKEAATKGTFAAMASEADTAKPPAAKSKPNQDPQKKDSKSTTTSTRKETTKQSDDRKRKHESTFSAMADDDDTTTTTTSTKRPRANQGRGTSDQAAPQRRSDSRGSTGRGQQHDDRSRGSWNAGRGGGRGGGRGPPNPPPRRSPPPPLPSQQQRSGGRGRGGGEGGGRGPRGGPVPGRGGRGPRRDGRRRY